MARISVERTHKLGLEAAREKARPLVEKLASQYGLTPDLGGRHGKTQALRGEWHPANQREQRQGRC